MLVMWPDSPDLLRDLLRRHGLDPNRVESPQAAWQVFWKFLAVDIDGLSWKSEARADVFAVSWGRHDWSDGLPTLTFGRHLAVDAVHTEPGRMRSESWELSLNMVFSDRPDLLDIGALNRQSSGAYECPGPGMDDAGHETLWEVEQYPTLKALWTSTPLWSAIGFGHRHPRVGNVAAFDAQQEVAYLEWRARNG